MNNLYQLKQAKEIIANLKKQKENEELSIKKIDNHSLKYTVNKDSQYGIRSDTLHKYESKEEPASNRYEEIRNIINNLKQKNVQKFNDVASVNKTIDNLTEQNTCDTFCFTDSDTKKLDENVLNDSGEIVSKSSVTYLKKGNNKRCKLKHNSSSKQLDLSEFYNVVKSVGNNNRNRECANEFQNKHITPNSVSSIKSETQTKKNQLEQKSLILNNTTTDFTDNKAVYIFVSKKKEYVPYLERSYSKPKERGVWDLFNSVKKNNEGQLVAKANTNKEAIAAEKLKQVGMVHIQREQHLKEIVSKNSTKSTMDDFWNKINNNKLQNCRLNTLNYSSSKENSFVKSFSAGNTISEKENHKDTNSIPLTNRELTNVKKQLEGNITVDNFFEEPVLKSINSKNGNNSKSKSDATVDDIHSEEKNGCNKMKEYKSEGTIISISSEQSNCNKEMQVSPRGKSYSDYDKEKLYNSECNTAVTLINENIDLSCQNNYHKLNQSSDQHILEKHNAKTISHDIDIDTYWSQCIYKCTDGERSACTSQINQPDLILENENSIMKDKRLKVEEENNIKDVCTCLSNHSENEAENCFESQISLLDNDLEKSILTEAYRKKKASEKTEENTEPFSLENFLENIVVNKEKKKTAPNKYNLKIKRYRKGKTKIYKLKKLKKRSIETQELNEDLNVHDLLKKITIESVGSQSRLSRFKSGSSISTSSSYVADDTKSDVLSTGSTELTSPQQRLRIGFNELSKDESLLYSANEWENISEPDKEDIKMKIQDLFFQILEDFKNKRSSYFRHRRQSFDNCIFKDGRLQFKPATESSMTVISSRAQKSKAKFQLMLHILKKIQTLLETGTKLTKRELYYQLKELISDQGATDRCINAISCLLDVGMWALNIIAQKGLVFGDLKLLLSSGEMLNCNVPGTLIPRDINDIAEVHSTAYFILVVEKESIFHKLIEEDLPNKLTRPFIMITGKGFPDLNTQLFLRKLWMVMSIPVFILVDADPHGINIMLNYRFGSVNNAHVSQHLAVPNAKWLGVYPSEIRNLNIARESLNEREIKLVNHMLATPYMEFSPRLVEELRVLLTEKFKAGIEGLMKTNNYLSDVYLPNKFFNHNFI